MISVPISNSPKDEASLLKNEQGEQCERSSYRFVQNFEHNYWTKNHPMGFSSEQVFEFSPAFRAIKIIVSNTRFQRFKIKEKVQNLKLLFT